MPSDQSLQETFLETLRKDRVPVLIFLVNGIKLQGQIESFDQFVVSLRNTASQVIYKRAISTVAPTSHTRFVAADIESIDESSEGRKAPTSIGTTELRRKTKRPGK